MLITPATRHELPALKAAGFTGYLVKPVRAASLAARLAAGDAGFERRPPTTPTKRRTATRQPPARKALSILVAEDNEINALLARALLMQARPSADHRGNGARGGRAWHAARDAGAPYDLVLMDMHMPGIDGLEATRRIRAAEAERGGARTPIIALTANAFAEDRDACLAAGMDGFLVKPLDRERLRECSKLSAGHRRRLRRSETFRHSVINPCPPCGVGLRNGGPRRDSLPVWHLVGMNPRLGPTI